MYYQYEPQNLEQFLAQFNNYCNIFKNTDKFLKEAKNNGKSLEKTTFQNVIANRLMKLCTHHIPRAPKDTRDYYSKSRQELKKYTNDEGIKYFRQHKRHPSTIPIDAQPLDRVASHNSAPDIALEEQENERWLQKKLKQLPSNQYLVLHLRQVEKKSTEEIAAIVGITPGSVVTLLARARQKMLQEIRKKKR